MDNKEMVNNLDDFQRDIINHYCDNDLQELKKMCNPLIRRKGVSFADYDDLYDDAMYVLMESVIKYDRDSNVPFAAYLYPNIKRSFFDWTRDRMREKRCNLQRDKNGKIMRDENGSPIPIYNVSFEAELEDGLSLKERIASEFDLESKVLEEYLISDEHIERYMSELPLRVRKIAMLIVQGYDKNQITEMLNIKETQYNEALKTMGQTEYVKYIIRR